MKKILILLSVVAGVALGATELLAPDYLAKNFNNIWRNGKFVLKNGVICVYGMPEKENNDSLKLCYDLTKLTKKEAPQARMKIEFEAKITKLSGQLEVVVREINAKGISIDYHGVTFRKNSKVPAWKKFSKEFKFSPQANTAALFIWTRNLAADDDVQLRNIKITKL